MAAAASLAADWLVCRLRMPPAPGIAGCDPVPRLDVPDFTNLIHDRRSMASPGFSGTILPRCRLALYRDAMHARPPSALFAMLVPGLLFVSGCAPAEGEQEREDPPPPTDYLLLTVSGHCFAGCADFNEEYLVDEGTAQVLADALPDADGEVLIGGVVDSYWSWVDGDDNLVALGFVDLVAVLDSLVDEWPEKTRNDTAVVLACHSHGCVWLHTALILVPDLPVAALVDIDAESYEWEWEWASEIADDSTDWGWDIGNAESGWEVDGLGDLQDVEDLVPNNVALDLEIVSDDVTWINDGDANHRMDGSERKIERFYSVENHESSDGPHSDGISWAADRLSEALR